MSWLSWIIFGFIAGGIAKWIHKGEDPGGCIVTIIIGIVGSVLGGFIGSTLLGWEVSSFWDYKSWILAIGGAIILLVIYRAITKKR